MKRLALFAISTSLFALACGSDDNEETPDASPPGVACPNSQDPANSGFICPTKNATAWTQDNGEWVEVGPANFDCLRTPDDLEPSTEDNAVTATVVDFQSGNPVEAATVTAFPGVDFENELDSGETDADGAVTLTLPAGQERVGYKVSAEGALDSYGLNHYYAPDATTSEDGLNSVSLTTANFVTAILGVSRTEGRGIVAGSISDCDGNTVSDAIATVSSTSESHEHLDGGQTYYFSGGANSLPTGHGSAPQTNKDGLFVVIELPEAASAYLQVWGFTSEQDPEGDELTLLAEIPAPVVGDSVIITSLQPLRE